MKQKKMPVRMCVACRQGKEKKELIRLVKTPEGHIVIDPTFKMQGRGAYVCKNMECVSRALKIRALDRALKAQMEGEPTERLMAAVNDEN